MKTHLFFKRILLVWILAFSSAYSWAQTPNGTLDFGSPTDGTTATTSNTGFGGVRVGSGGGGFTLRNPGQSIGTAGELRGVAPTGGSINSVGITSTEYGTAAATFTIAFDLHLTGGSSGIWYFFAGNGASFGSTQSTGFTSAQIFTGLRWTFGTSNTISTNNRNGANWAVDGLSSAFAQDTAYRVVIVGNNTGSVVNYNGGNSSVAVNTYDLWINGTLVGDNIAKGQLSGSSNINAFRFYSESSTGNVAQIALDNITWYNTCVLPTPTWNGTSWIGGTPSASTDAVIDNDYTGASFTANNVTVNATRTLTLNSGTTVTSNNMTNNGAVVVNDGGNFIQTASGSYSGSGTFAVNRNSASVANKYAFWSSPVSASNIYAVFPGFTPQYVMTYNTATDFYDVVPDPTATTAGIGYSVKIPATASNLTFNGTPNNGSINTTLSTVGNTYNLVGNPYPSNLDLPTFYTANSANIGSTLWFWDNTSNSVTTQTGNTTVNVGYATYNAASSTWVAAPTAAAPSENAAKIGQGFIVEALSTTLGFTNSMRVAATGVSLNKNTANEGKYWLKLTTPYGSYMSQAVTYQQGASNAYDAFDSKAMATGSDAFYSLSGLEKLIIQGRAPFDIDDVVQLGNKHFENGQFTITLSQKEGLFANGQVVYLKDKLLGTETNLQSGAYTFASNSGDFTNRFEIVYKQSFLGTVSATDKNDLKVYRSGNDFIIDSPEKIHSVEVYDASGKLLQSIKSGLNKQTVTNLTKGVYFFQINTDSGKVSRKVLK